MLVIEYSSYVQTSTATRFINLASLPEENNGTRLHEVNTKAFMEVSKYNHLHVPK